LSPNHDSKNVGAAGDESFLLTAKGPNPPHLRSKSMSEHNSPKSPGPTNIIQWLMHVLITPWSFKIANGNGHGNILQSWAVLTNPSRVVAFRDETSHQTA
jgi:hypothetical protein